MESPNKPGILCTVQVLKVSLLPWSRDRRVPAALGWAGWQETGLRDLYVGVAEPALCWVVTQVCAIVNTHPAEHLTAFYLV